MWLHCQAFRQNAIQAVPEPAAPPVPSENADAALKCPICLSKLRAPMIGSCGHAICEACLFQWIGILDCAEGEHNGRADHRCVVCRRDTPWFHPCRALNGIVSPDAAYSESSMVITDRFIRNRQVFIETNVHIFLDKRYAKTTWGRCRRWFGAPGKEWLLRLALIGAGAAFYSATTWIYYAMAVIALCLAAAWTIKEVRMSGVGRFGMDQVALVSVAFVVGLCTASHFLATAAYWLLPSAAVVGFFYSNTILREL